MEQLQPMPNLDQIPDDQPLGPLTVFCPLCGATPNHDCTSTTGRRDAIHPARIRAAAIKDAARRKSCTKPPTPADPPHELEIH